MNNLLVKLLSGFREVYTLLNGSMNGINPLIKRDQRWCEGVSVR